MSVLEAYDVTKFFREGAESFAVSKGASLQARTGRDRRPGGTIGFGEDDLPDDPRLHADAELRAGRHRGSRGRSGAARSAPRIPPCVDRLRLPAVQPVPGADGGRERRVRAEPQGAEGDRRPARGRASARRGGACPTGPASCRATCREDRSSAWRSPGAGRLGADPAGRRADRQPRLPGRHPGPRPVPPAGQGTRAGRC